MFDIETTLSEYGLTVEQYEELLKDCSDKVGKISDLDWGEILNKYSIDWNGDTCRKAQQPPLLGGAFVREYYLWKHSRENSFSDDNYLKELDIKKDEIFKETKKLSDQRREYNKIRTSDARAEHLMTELVKCANKLNDEKPLKFEEKWVKPNIRKEALLCFADWHYGMITDNIWNTYNTDICKHRVKQTVEMAKLYITQNNIDVLHIALLGDSAHGSIHVGCRVQSEEDTCDQLMHVSEILAEAINNLSTVVNHINFYSCYGNHLRTIQNKNESIHSDNMEKIVPWWMKERLKNNSKVEIIESEYKEFTRIDILGNHIVAIHGDLEKNFKNIGVTMNTLFTKKFDTTIDYTISADKHHTEEFEQMGIDSILVPALCGSDEYANNGRLYSNAGQTLIIFNNYYGKECVYPLPLQ